jgi:hypothetical protein
MSPWCSIETIPFESQYGWYSRLATSFIFSVHCIWRFPQMVPKSQWLSRLYFNIKMTSKSWSSMTWVVWGTMTFLGTLHVHPYAQDLAHFAPVLGWGVGMEFSEFRGQWVVRHGTNGMKILGFDHRTALGEPLIWGCEESWLIGQ